MPWSLLEIPSVLPAYALVLFRLSGLFLTAPVFSSAIIPARVRGAVVLVTAAMVLPLVGRQAPGELTLTMALVGGVGELMIGATIGLALAILVMSAEVGGLMIGRQAGLALANVYDPTRNETTSIVGQLYTITLVLVFLVAGGHRAAIAAVLDTFAVIPLLSFRFDESIVMLTVEMLASAFILGIRLGVPVLIAMFLTATAMAFLSRTMPQMNILSVGFTVRVMIALAVGGIALGACQDLLLDSVWDGLEMIYETFGLDPGRIRLLG